MRKTKLEKGITLVALIITIVVLLILAVVSIGAVRNSGIIGHATNTSDAWKQAQKNEVGYLEGYEEKLAESTGAKVVKYVGEVPIPVGFKYVEGDKDSGLVISDGTNEFVWIPVKTTLPDASTEVKVVTGDGSQYDAISSNLVKAGMPSGSTSEDFLAQLTAEYEAMVASVKEYKGFYVGRYEVSDNGGKAQSVKGAISANADDKVFESDIPESPNRTWYGLYKLCKTYKTSSVTSSMIWGCQYEAMMTFIGSTEASKTGRVSHNLSSSYLTGNGQGKGQYSGSVVYNDIINNIYDLEGNMYEWTLETNGTDNRVVRGGDFLRSRSPSESWIKVPTYTGFYYPHGGSYVSDGSRLTLYVEL